MKNFRRVRQSTVLTLVRNYHDLSVSRFQASIAARVRSENFLESARISRGDCLLVQSLDRILRDQVGEALDWFFEVLIGMIAATLPDKRIYGAQRALMTDANGRLPD